VAKLTEITVSISRKLSDDNYGSFGVQAAITLEVAEGEDKDELYLASASWLSEKVAGTHKAHGTLASPTVPAGAVLKAAPQKAPAPVKVGAAPSDEDVFDVESIVIEVMPDGVTKTAKAKGGKWTKYGVKVWDEVLALPPLEWDLKALDVAEYGPPDGLQAVVMMVDANPRRCLSGSERLPRRVGRQVSLPANPQAANQVACGTQCSYMCSQMHKVVSYRS